MISSGAHTSFHSSIFRRGHSPTLPERSSSFSFTKLPPIHSLLPSNNHPEVIQRPRGTTLPSYHPSENRSRTSPSDSTRTSSRSRRIETGISSQEENVYSDQDDENGSNIPGGVSLPPIRVEDDTSPMRTFSGLPPIKTMLPSHSRLHSLDPRSPASPQSSQSIARLSSSWSSNVMTSGSSGDIAGRFQRE